MDSPVDSPEPAPAPASASALTTDPESWACVCPGCGTSLWARRGGEMTLKAGVLKIGDNGRVLARCPGGNGCREDVPVPFLIWQDPPPASPRRRVRLVAKKP